MKNYKDKNWLYRKYILEGLSSYKIAELLGCTAKTISNWLSRHGIETKKAADYQRANLDELVLHKLYLEEKKNIAEVADILCVSSNTVIKYLRKYNIKSRRVSDYASFIEGYLKGREKLIGRPRSLQTRIKISKTKTSGEWKGFTNQDSIFKQHRNLPQYKKWRQIIFKRDNFTCQECGTRGGNLELHHIIPLRDYGKGIMEKGNAITLCQKCHSKTKSKEYEFVAKYKEMTRKDF